MEFLLLAFTVVSLMGLTEIFLRLKESYSSLQKNRELLLERWLSLDAILKQQYDEASRLISFCGPYIKYEEEIIQDLLHSREQMAFGSTVKEKAQSTNDHSRCIHILISISENYSQLRMDQAFKEIQVQFHLFEELVSERSRSYNESVMSYNHSIQQVPTVFMAAFLNYKHESFFIINEREKSLSHLTLSEAA